MNKIFTLLVVVSLCIMFGATAQADTSQKCYDDCIAKYTPEFANCKDVLECKRFVSNKVKSCIVECESVK